MRERKANTGDVNKFFRVSGREILELCKRFFFFCIKKQDKNTKRQFRFLPRCFLLINAPVTVAVFNPLLSKGANVGVVRLLHPNELTERHLSAVPFSEYRLA